MQISVAILKKLAPTAKPARLQAIVSAAPRVLWKYGIVTPLRLQHFFAQLAHESGDFNIGRENTNYSASNLAKIWDSGNWHSYFPSKAALQRYAGRGEALLNIVYGGRMGNGPASSGDGYRYRGGGLAQITGKDGYANMQKITGVPLVAQPELVFDDLYLLEIAAGFWRWKRMEALADADDFDAICMRWNGARKISSVIGLADRRKRLAIARKIFTSGLDLVAAPVAAYYEPAPVVDADADGGGDQEFQDFQPDDSPPDAEPSLAPDVVDNTFYALPGSEGDPRVFYVQTSLKARGISPGVIDGKWGGATSGALARMINDRRLDALNAPTSAAEFDALWPVIHREVAKAVAENWHVPVSAERKAATPAVVAEIAPEVVPQKRNFLAGLWATIVALVSAVWSAVSDPVMQAYGWLTDNKDTGIGTWIMKRASEVPIIVWALLAAGVAIFFTVNAWSALKTSTNSVKSGERV